MGMNWNPGMTTAERLAMVEKQVKDLKKQLALEKEQEQEAERVGIDALADTAVAALDALERAGAPIGTRVASEALRRAQGRAQLPSEGLG